MPYFETDKDHIKVVIRFKGKEELGEPSNKGGDRWSLDEKRSEILPPSSEKNKIPELFTFD